MGFRINTNVMALSAHATGSENNRKIGDSLEKLSSGLRINKAADDASGLAIANSLRSQANSLGQAIKNANDGIGIMQTADKAIDEQSKILDTVKTKATQAAQDGQTEETRKAIQKDITKLMEELDNIAETTSFNGQSLLSGQYTDKKFQIGANSNETISLDIGATSSDKIGHVRFETGKQITAAMVISNMKFGNVDGMQDVTLESVILSHSAGTGIGVLAETINKSSDQLGIKASWSLTTTATKAISATLTAFSLTINGISIGTIDDVEANDKDGRLVNAINEQTDKTGVIASLDERGKLELKSTDGRGILVSTTNTKMGIANGDANYGRLTLIKLDGSDIAISGGLTKAGMSTLSVGKASAGSEATINLRDIKRGFTLEQADAMGMFTSKNDAKYTKAVVAMSAVAVAGSISGPQAMAIGAGVTTLEGAMAVMSIADAAVKDLDSIRSEIGSTQNQMVSTINNISVTQVNLKAAESNIRDVDFAEESANFQKANLLAQAGSYVAGQANSQQQGVMQLLR
jgi:flagellin